MGIVPHTHWDREWHVPFQAGRVRLVALLDAVLDDLESGALAHFWLDGQTAAVDDYLAVRPEAERRVRAAVAAGRLGIGPWVVQMDEFVVSPETIVRNLEAGIRRRAELGAPGPAVGYGPDVWRSPPPPSGGRRPTARRCGPSTSTAPTPTGEGYRPTGRGSSNGPGAGRRRSATGGWPACC